MHPLILAFQYLMISYLGTPLGNLFNNFFTADKDDQLTWYFPNGNQDVTEGEAFDFIIVGGGSAGCVVANRLSAENYQVLLLEAGGNPFPLTSIPAMAWMMLGQPDIDWNLRSVPQKNSFKAYVNNTFTIPRGKGLGGSSLLNFMAYMRGNAHDYDYWAEVTGDKSWKYENVMPYFKRMENYQGSFPNDKLHGKEGPLSVEAPTFVPMQEEWLAAGQEIGLGLNDPNGYQKESVFPIDTTTMKGTRFSTHSAYLHPALGRPNLRVITYAHVLKVHFDDQNKAVAVSYQKKGKKFHVTAKKEIILSAGTLSSPQILMLSGIGPKDHLQSLGIPVKVDLPVGQNFQDHFITFIAPFTVEKGKSTLSYNAETLREYLTYGTGPYSTLGTGAGAQVTSSINNNPGWPDIYLTYNSISKEFPAPFEAGNGVKPGTLQKYMSADLEKDSLMAVVVLSRPKSHGEIKLASTNPFECPLIHPNFFSHPDDIKVVVEGVQKVVGIITKTKAFAKIGATMPSSLFPGCEKFTNYTDEYWECYARHFSGTMNHQSGTCRMGKSSGDPGAVLDSQLRVLGTKGLRVVDASIMPQVTSTNTNAPTIMIGEKGSDMILASWKNTK